MSRQTRVGTDRTVKDAVGAAERSNDPASVEEAAEWVQRAAEEHLDGVTAGRTPGEQSWGNPEEAKLPRPAPKLEGPRRQRIGRRVSVRTRQGSKRQFECTFLWSDLNAPPPACASCGKPEIHAKGLCQSCYRRKRKAGL